jgi:hypothetical protein
MHYNGSQAVTRSAKRCVTVLVEEYPVFRRIMTFGAILALIAMVFFVSWPAWKWILVKPVSAKVYERTQAAVEKNPRLKPAWDIALQDGVLTREEAKVILESAGEKVEPDE